MTDVIVSECRQLVESDLGPLLEIVRLRLRLGLFFMEEDVILMSFPTLKNTDETHRLFARLAGMVLEEFRIHCDLLCVPEYIVLRLHQ